MCESENGEQVIKEGHPSMRVSRTVCVGIAVLVMAMAVGCRKSSSAANDGASPGGSQAADSRPGSGGQPGAQSGPQQAFGPAAAIQSAEAVHSGVATQPTTDMDPEWAARQAQATPAGRRSPVVTPLRQPDALDVLKRKPLYRFNEREVDIYLRYLSRAEPNPINRLLHLMRKNIGQPYELYLLGEFPYETYDPDPMYCLSKSDCVTFCEHMYAMAFSRDWASFFQTLQKLRYRDGQVSILTRNHETLCDWDRNNAWLFNDLTRTLARPEQLASMNVLWRPSKFFAQFGIGQDLPDVRLADVYVPRRDIPRIAGQLRDGDFVNVIRGDAAYQWCGHVGIIGHGPSGQVHLIHSSAPAVREEPLVDYLARNGSVLGMKFLRLKDNPQQIVDSRLPVRAVEPASGAVAWAASGRTAGDSPLAGTEAKKTAAKAKTPQRAASPRRASGGRKK